MKEYRIRPLVVALAIGTAATVITTTSGCSSKTTSPGRYTSYEPTPAVSPEKEIVQEAPPDPSTEWSKYLKYIDDRRGLCWVKRPIPHEVIADIEKNGGASWLYCLGHSFDLEDNHQQAKKFYDKAREVASDEAERSRMVADIVKDICEDLNDFCTPHAATKSAYEAAYKSQVAEDIRLRSDARIGQIFLEEKNYEEAFKHLREPALKDIGGARNEFAVLYQIGADWIKNDAEASRWLFRVVQEGKKDYVYQYNFSAFLEHREDYRNALAWAMLAKDVFEAEKSAELRDSNKHWLDSIDDIITDIKRKLREKGSNVERVVSEATKLKSKLLKEEQKKVMTGGTGFYVNDSHILTNKHVVYEDGKPCDYVSIMSPTDTVPRFVNTDKVDASLDLAVLSDPNYQDRNVPDSRLQHVKLRNPNQRLSPGEYVIVTGFPLDYELALEMHTTTGVVVASSTAASDRRQFIISAPVQSGNSGGPVLDANGNVIGVVVKKRDLRSRGPGRPEEVIQNMNDAISLDQVRGFLDKNQVSYEEATLSLPIDNNGLAGAPIVDKSRRQVAPLVSKQAQGYTVLVECWMSAKE